MSRPPEAQRIAEGERAERRVALVTGSASGLGASTARLLLQRGFHVAVNYRTASERTDGRHVMLDRADPHAIALVGDVRDSEQAEALVRDTIATFGRLDVLVHAAGPFLRDHTALADVSPEAWHDMVDGNLSSTFHLVRLAVPEMRSRGWGRVVLFGFAEAGRAPAWPGRGAYAAAKTGVISFARTLAQEEASHGITVNVVCPGDIRSPWKEASIDEARQARDGRTPLGRPGTGEDVARAIAFLCEEDSDFITGSIIEATGGLNPLRRRAGKPDRGDSDTR